MKKLMSLVRLHHSRLIFPLLFILTLLWGCRDSSLHRTLLQADSVMETDPDSAYALLAPLQVDSTAPAGDRALHALLLTQAMHKTDMIWRDSVRNNAIADSLIDIALRYYEVDKTDNLLMRAYFYRGELDALSPDDFIKALEPFSRSLDIALRMKDDYWTARNYSSMARVYYDGGAYGDEAEAQKKSVEYFKRTDKENFIKHSISEYAIGLHNASRYDEALEMENELLEMVTPESDPYLWSEASIMKARTLFAKKEPEKCISVIDLLEENGQKEGDIELFRILCHIYLGNLSKAHEYYTRYESDLDDESKTMITNAFARSAGDKDKQLETLREIFEGLSDEYTQFTTMGFNTMQMMINRGDSERHEEEMESMILDNNQRLFYTFMLSLILILVIGLLLAIFLYKKRIAEEKLKDSEKEKASLAQGLDEMKLLTEEEHQKNSELTRELESLSEEMNQILVQTKKLNLQTCELTDERNKLQLLLDDYTRQLKEKIHTLNLITLRGEYRWLNDVVAVCNLNKGKSPSQRDNKILESMKRRLYMFDIDNTKDRSTVESSVDKLIGNVMKNLRRKVVVDSELYYHVALLLILGFNMDSIAYFTHKDNIRSVYNVVSRLRRKIMELPAEEREQFAILLPEKNSGTQNEDEKGSE